MKNYPPRAGVLITLEGPDGSGKTTQLRLLQERLLQQGLQAVVTREPGGTAIGERLREILLHPNFEEMTVACEVLLYSAARAQLLAEVIRPALQEGRVVLSDRFFDSSTVYQGYAGAENPEMIERINLWAAGGVVPDLTVLLNIDAERGLCRLQEKAGRDAPCGDRMEKKALDFHRRVQEGYLSLAQREADRFCLVDAAAKIQEVQAAVWEAVWMLLQERNMAPGPEAEKWDSKA